MQQKLLQSAKILERMLNLNTFDDIAQVLTKYIILSSLQCFCKHHSDSLYVSLLGLSLLERPWRRISFSSWCSPPFVGQSLALRLSKAKIQRYLSIDYFKTLYCPPPTPLLNLSREGQAKHLYFQELGDEQ